MFKNLFTRLKEERLVSQTVDANYDVQMADDDSTIEKLSEYLIANFGYTSLGVKEILTNIYKGEFSVKNPKHRQEFIATLKALVRLETVNKYNTLFIDASGRNRGPLVVLSDLSQIRLNPSVEASAFITINERVIVEQFNEEATNASF